MTLKFVIFNQLGKFKEKLYFKLLLKKKPTAFLYYEKRIISANDS